MISYSLGNFGCYDCCHYTCGTFRRLLKSRYDAWIASIERLPSTIQSVWLGALQDTRHIHTYLFEALPGETTVPGPKRGPDP